MKRINLEVIFLVELGENFHGRPFVTKPDQPSLQAADQLNCNQFDENCRWKSTGHAKEVAKF